MTNYRYNTSDHMRRNTYGRQTMSPSSLYSVNSGSSCCEDKSENDELNGMPLAMAYVPWQEWRALYEVQKGFHRGTIFEELDKPFHGKGGCCR